MSEPSHPTECELKFSCTEQEFRSLRKFLSPNTKDTSVQLNLFFDTKGRKLFRFGSVLRLRQMRAKTLLTLKSSPKHSRIRGYHIRSEFECSVSKAEATRIKRNPTAVYEIANSVSKALRDHFGYLPLTRIGSFRNTRVTIRYRGLTIELDQYQGRLKKHFELEVETTQPSQALKKLDTLFRHLGISPSPDDSSKFMNAVGFKYKRGQAVRPAPF